MVFSQLRPYRRRLAVSICLLIFSLPFVNYHPLVVAVAGSNGSGKSTLLNLVPRFCEVTGGRITVDSLDVRELRLPDLHGAIGYVGRENYHFDGIVPTISATANPTPPR